MSSSNRALLQLLKREQLVPQSVGTDCIDSTVEGLISGLARRGIIDEQTVLQAISKKLGIALIDLDDRAVRKQFSFQLWQETIKPDFCLQHRILPLYLERDSVVVATADPLALDTLKSLEFSLSRPVLPILAAERQIVRLLDEHYSIQLEHHDQISDLGTEVVEVITQSDSDIDEKELLGEAAPIIQLCNKIIASGFREDASDIHIEPSADMLEVRYRVDGVMKDVLQIPKRLQGHVISRIKLMAGMDITERRRPQDGRVRTRIGMDFLDLRISAVPAGFGEKIVMRLLRAEAVGTSFDSLGIPERAQQALTQALRGKAKLIISTGPTGSGKTTTLYTCLNYLKDGRTNIETVENPIEYKIPGIHQIQINEGIGVTFASALRAILRQDPDVIMIGEIRDHETADIALQAAQTGHIVLSTLHTNDAPSAITRLLNLGIEPYTIAAGVAGVIAQRLVRKLCPECKVCELETDDQVFLNACHHFGKTVGPCCKSIGCAACGHTGFKGRIGLFSYLEMTDSIARLIHERASLPQIEQQAVADGFTTLEAAAIDLCLQGVTSIKEIHDYLEVRATKETKLPETPAQVLVPKAAKHATVPNSAAEAKQNQLKRPTIIVVDDDPDIRTLFVHLLTKERYTVFEASNGADGLDLVYQHNPTLVLCDLSMPIMDGKEFLMRMRSNQDTRKIPVVILTAENSEVNELSLLNIGAREFLGKKDSPAKIVTRLRRVLSE